MSRPSILEAGDLPRYLWQRTGARSRLPETAAVPDERSLRRVADWVQSGTSVPVLSICIPTKDRLDLLLPCLLSLARTCAGRPVEVVIGDTGSNPQTFAAYSRMGIEAVSIAGPFSFSQACNQMARVARGEVVLFLNNDTEASCPNWVDHVLAAPDHQIVGAALIYPGTRRLQSAGVRSVPCRRRPQRNVYRPPRQHDRGCAVALQSIGLGKRLDSMPEQPANVMATSGAFLATTKAQFEALGGYDEAFQVDLQDIDYCLRARATGVEVICRPDIVFVHRHAGSRGRYAFPIDDWRLFVSRWERELERWARLS